MDLLSVGEVAARLGVAPSTVRMWGQRYGLVASARSAGGHRRYTRDDLDLLRRMHEAVIAGETPAAAAARARTATADTDAARDSDGAREADGAREGGRAEGGRTRSAAGDAPAARTRYGGGAVLALPGAGREAQGIGRASARLDEAGTRTMVLQALQANGAIDTWDRVLRPVLVAAGAHWQRGGNGIEVEHLLTQAITMAFTQYLTGLPEAPQDHAVVLAGAPDEDHVLPLHAARAALAERGVPARVLGARTPSEALASTVKRIRPAGVLLWSTIPDPRKHKRFLPAMGGRRGGMPVLLGGAGWQDVPTGPATMCASLEQAVTLLEQAWRRTAEVESTA